MAHWIQNRSVSFFVTPDARQICFPPWSEYHILQYQILLGNDRLAALPQWLVFLGSCIAASLLAAQLGASRRIQILAATVAGTLPMGILQASSTQNDLTAAFWLLTAAVFGLAQLDDPLATVPAESAISGRSAAWGRSAPRSDCFSCAAPLFGLAAGLSLLTKTTAYLFAAPVLLLIGLAVLSRRRIAGLGALAIAAAMALLLNLPFYVRNVQFCGRPLGDGPHHVVEYRNTHHTMKVLASNLMRNAGLQFVTPSPRFNSLVELGIRFGHKVIGADIDDPSTTFAGNRYKTRWSTFEDNAANPLHFVLVCLLLPLGWFLLAPDRVRRWFRGAVVALGAGLILLCWVLMWQPFHSRQHITLFLLAAPLVALSASRLPRSRFWVGSLSIILLLTSFPYVFHNEKRPLLSSMSPRSFKAANIFVIPRQQQYLSGPLPESWRAAARFIASHGYRSVGLKVRWFSCEYPLWLIMKENPQPVRLEHVAVTNMPFTPSLRAAAASFTPDAILRFSDVGVLRLQPGPNEIFCNGYRYLRTWSAREPGRPDVGAELYTRDRR